MGWFRRLKDKIRKFTREDDVVYEGTLPAIVPRETPPEPPILTRFPAEELTAEGRAYLNRYPDVAAHKEPPHVYGERPRAHYLDHGKAEGRIWDIPPKEETVVQPPVARSPKGKPPLDGERFVFGKIESSLIYGTDDNQKHATNFDFLMEKAGPAAAFDYLLKHVQGGAALYRSAAQAAGLTDSAKVVNRYGVGAAKGRVENGEYILGGNPFTKEGGVKYKLPR